ncbi:hypothetical protein SRHO_G00110820 [Serrasalmus rhombeus]
MLSGTITSTLPARLHCYRVTVYQPVISSTSVSDDPRENTKQVLGPLKRTGIVKSVKRDKFRRAPNSCSFDRDNGTMDSRCLGDKAQVLNKAAEIRGREGLSRNVKRSMTPWLSLKSTGLAKEQRQMPANSILPGLIREGKVHAYSEALQKTPGKRPEGMCCDHTRDQSLCSGQISLALLEDKSRLKEPVISAAARQGTFGETTGKCKL